MRQQTISQFWFEPGALRWHYISGVGYFQQLGYAYGVQAERQFHFTTVNSFF
jgi:hypothetical protein